MAKFDKNIKNEFLSSEEFYDDEFYEDEEDPEALEEDDEDEDFFEEKSDIYEEPQPEEEDKPEKSDEDSNPFIQSASLQADGAQWYVVHTYSGHENKVKANIEKIVENRGMQDLIQCVVMPTEDVVEIKNGQRKVKTRKVFPGYVLVKMIVTNESWYLIRNTQGVTGFVGHGSDPIPLTSEEVRRLGIEQVSISVDLEAGDTIKVIGGPFDSFMGTIEEVNIEKQTLKVCISMFGRETPVELEFNQVEKIV